MTYQETVTHALSHQMLSLEQQRDAAREGEQAARRWAESALAECGVLRLVIQDALALTTEPAVRRVLRGALTVVPTQRVAS